MLKDHIKLSKLAKLSILFVVLVISFNVTFKVFEGVKIRNTVMGSDMEGYYQYLPYVLLKDREEISHMRWAKPYGEDKKLNVFTCGVAIMQLPFFLLAHGITKYLELEPTGYGPVYFTSVFIATIFYVLAGLIFLYYWLMRFFKPKIAGWVTVLVFAATNLFYYTVMSPGMSHAYSFSLVAMYLYFVPRFYENTNLRNTLFTAFPIALLTLIRPTSLVLAIYFILYDVNSFSSLKERFLFFLNNRKYIIIFPIVGFIVFIPQMLYWHEVTGHFFIYSYQEEGFTNLLSPKIFTVLFGPRNGWFLYTPLMLVAFIGLLFLGLKRKLNSIPTLIILVIIIYLNGSWWRPTFSSASGYRALIEYIPIMTVPLAFIVERIYMSKNKIWLNSMIMIFTVFVVFNILFAFKYSPWLWWNTEWQWSHFLRLVRF